MDRAYFLTGEPGTYTVQVFQKTGTSEVDARPEGVDDADRPPSSNSATDDSPVSRLGSGGSYWLVVCQVRRVAPAGLRRTGIA
jgi:hypothetical protein